MEQHQEVVVQSDGRFTEDATSVFRINTVSGVQQLSQIPLPFSVSTQKLDVVEAYTTTADGQRVDVAPENIKLQQSPISVGAPMFSDFQLKTVIFPATAAGVTLTLKTHMEQTTPTFPGQFSFASVAFPNWDVHRKDIHLTAPVGYTLHMEAPGLQGGALPQPEPGKQEWRWQFPAVPAQPPENFSVSPIKDSPHLFVTSFSDWDAAAQAYLKRARTAAAVTPEVQGLADRLTQGTTDRRLQAQALYNWVSQNIRYVYVALGNEGSWVPHDANAILGMRYGDCKDHTTLLQALLAAKGISSSPVMANLLQAWYQVPQVAMLVGGFDHSIVYVPEFQQFLDPTNNLARYSQTSMLAKPALVLDDGTGHARVMTIPSQNAGGDWSRRTAQLVLDAQGDLQGQVQVTAGGMPEISNRRSASSITAGMEPTYAAQRLKASDYMGTGTYVLRQPDDLTLPYVYDMQFSIQNYAAPAEPQSKTVPTGVPAFRELRSFGRQQALAMPERRTAMTWNNETIEENTELTLPANARITQLPKPVHVANGAGNYDASYAQRGQTIVVQRKFSTHLPPEVSGENYKLLRDLSSAVARDFQSRLHWESSTTASE